MKKYHCYGTVIGSKYLGEVEAENIEEAMTKAWELEEAWISFCHQCSRECEDPMVSSIHVESDDGEETKEENIND